MHGIDAGREWVRRGCDCSKSLSTFNKQVVGESPPIGVSGRKHQVGINNATRNQVFKHDVKKEGHDSSWHLHPIASPNGVLWGRPVLLGLEGLGDKRQSPLASVDGCETVGLHLESFHHDRARQRQPALASPRPTPGDAPTRCGSSELTFHFISRREGDD